MIFERTWGERGKEEMMVLARVTSGEMDWEWEGKKNRWFVPPNGH